MTSELGTKTSEQINWLSNWIDEYPPNLARSVEACLWGRISKIGEEFGEVIEAMVGMTDRNPRKGKTHEIWDVRKELFDVALAALAAVAHLKNNRGDVMTEFAAFVESRWERAIDHDTTP